MNRRQVLGTISGLVSGLAGCQGLIGDDDGPPVEDVELNIADLRKPEYGLTSATITFIFEVINGNQSEPIPSPVIDYQVHINNAEVLSTREQIPPLDPSDKRLEEFTITLDYDELAGDIVDSIQGETFTFEVRGKIESEGSRTDFSDKYEL